MSELECWVNGPKQAGKRDVGIGVLGKRLGSWGVGYRIWGSEAMDLGFRAESL